MNDEIIYPRVLIINAQSIYQNNATGITLRKLWEKWPPSSVMELCVHAEGNISLDEDAIKSVALKKTMIARLAGSSASKKINAGIKQNNAAPASAHTGLKECIRQFCACTLVQLSAKMTKEQWDRIEEFKPDVIYTLGGGVSVLRLVRKVSRKFKIGIVMHFMDNWLEHNQWENNILLKPYYVYLKKCAHQCLKRCRNVITISPSMAKHYEQKLDIPCEVLMNMVDMPEERPQPVAQTSENVRFVYAGGLHLDRWKALKTIAESIKRHINCGILQIYTSEANRALYEKHFVDLPVAFMPPVPHDRVAEVLATASFLVHAEVTSAVLEGFFKYSVSTKVPEYMSSGRPFLFYAPGTLGVYQYLDENNAAILADSQTRLDTVMQEIADGRDYTEIIENAWNLAKKNHSSANGWECLRSAMVAGAYHK